LTRDPQAHLSPEEFRFLSEEGESVSQGDFDREVAEAHAETCSLCGPRLRSHRSLQANLGNLAVLVASEQKSECPPEQTWVTLAAGLTPITEAPGLLEHASHCDHCGPMLRAASEIMNPEVSDAERDLIRNLPTVETTWQRVMAEKMAKASAKQVRREHAIPARLSTTTEQMPSRASTEQVATSASARTSWLFAKWTRWAVPLGAAAAIGVAMLVYSKNSTPSLSKANDLIAQAYTEQRPIEWRFPGAGYGPVRQQRGGNSNPSYSQMDEPPQLLEARILIARGLAHHPQDPGWLQAKARADLFDGQCQSAIKELQKALQIRFEDASLDLDLATAYFQNASQDAPQEAQQKDYALALLSLNRVLDKEPNNLIALFNRAVVYGRLHRHDEAKTDWLRYLKEDPVGEWSRAARALSEQ